MSKKTSVKQATKKATSSKSSTKKSVKKEEVKQEDTVVSVVETLDKVEKAIEAKNELVSFKEDSEASKLLRESLTSLLSDIKEGKVKGKKALFKDYTKSSASSVRVLRDKLKFNNKEDKLQEQLQHLSTLIVSELTRLAELHK